jgi:ribosomal protein S20
MPRTKTATKELRKNARNRGRNLKRRKRLMEALKGHRKLLAADKSEEAQVNFPKVMQTLDKLAKIGYVKRGYANRMKSRLSKQLKKKSSASLVHGN